MDPSAKILFDYMRDIIYNSDHASLEPDNLRSDFRELGKGMQYFAACLKETQTLAKALSQGRLDITLPAPENEMAAPLKALHAKMRHLTWQAQQIASGDYSQRIDFMGEFSRAFNTMAVLCRMGGDEFMLLAQNWCCKNAEEQMEELRTRLISCNIAEGNYYEHSISYGIIEYNGDRDVQVHDLLSTADEKMYEYKRAYKMKNKINLN